MSRILTCGIVDAVVPFHRDGLLAAVGQWIGGEYSGGELPVMVRRMGHAGDVGRWTMVGVDMIRCRFGARRTALLLKGEGTIEPGDVLAVMEAEPASRTYDPSERAREKEASRDEDEQALAAGEKTREQLRAENGYFAGLRIRVNLDGAKRLA